MLCQNIRFVTGRGDKTSKVEAYVNSIFFFSHYVFNSFIPGFLAQAPLDFLDTELFNSLPYNPKL